MPRVASSFDTAFGSDADNRQKKGPSICELSDYEKLNSGQDGGKSESSSGASASSSSSSSSDGSAKKKTNLVASGGAGRHTKRLVDMKTAAAVAAVNNSSSVGAKKVAAAASSSKKANRSIGSATKKKGSEVKKKKKKPVVKKRQAAVKPAARPVAEPGRLVRISDYQGRVSSPFTSPITRLSLTFTPEAVDGDAKGKKKGKSTTATPSKRRATMVSGGGTGRFNIKQG